MQIMLCSSTVSSSSNASMREVDGGEPEGSSCEEEQSAGLFGKLLEQIVMGGCGETQSTSKAEIDLTDMRPLQQDLDETEAEETVVPWYSVLIDPTWLSQSFAADWSDVQNSDMQGVCELQFPETGSSMGQIDVQVPIGIALTHEVVAHFGTGLREQMNTKPLAFGEVPQGMGITDVTAASLDEYKPEALELTVDTSEQAFFEEHVSVQEQFSGRLAPALDAHSFAESYLQAVEKDTVLEEPYRQVVSDLAGVGNSGSPSKQPEEISSQYAHKEKASHARNSVEAVKPDSRADKERLPIVPLDGVSQANEQEQLTLPNVQDQIDEVRERAIPEQIIESVEYLKYDETKEFNIELTPKELGRVRMSITTDGERVNVHFVADNPSVAEVIRTELPGLRDILARQGLMFGQVNVGVGQDANTDGNSEYRAPARSAYPVKGLEHTAENDMSYQFSRSGTYGQDVRLQVDYVA